MLPGNHLREPGIINKQKAEQGSPTVGQLCEPVPYGSLDKRVSFPVQLPHGVEGRLGENTSCSLDTLVGSDRSS